MAQLSVSRSVQFDTADGVLSAYVSRDVPAFSIWCGKQFLHKYEGNAMNEGANILEAIMQTLVRSAAIYTLAVYEVVPEKGIKPSTEYDGSFNFQLRDKPLGYLGDQQPVPGMGLNQLVKRLDELQDEIQELQTENEKLKQQQEKPVEKGFLAGLIEEPGIKEAIISNAVGWLNQIFKAPAAAIAGAAPAPVADHQMPAGSVRISGIDAPTAWDTKVSTDQKKTIDQALYVMVTRRGDIPEILAKLSKMAQAKPDQFNSYITMFKAMG